jgi:hypothetical protein
MVKPLSEQLADLSVRAKSTEDALAAAQKEAHDKIEARKQQARAAATKAIEKVNQEVKSAGDSATRDWNTVKAKIASDMTTLKANVAHAKHDLDVKHAENRADRLEWEAGFAIDYAIASVEQAKLAVLDAIDSRAEVDVAKRACRNLQRAHESFEARPELDVADIRLAAIASKQGRLNVASRISFHGHNPTPYASNTMVTRGS